MKILKLYQEILNTKQVNLSILTQRKKYSTEEYLEYFLHNKTWGSIDNPNANLLNRKEEKHEKIIVTPDKAAIDIAKKFKVKKLFSTSFGIFTDDKNSIIFLEKLIKNKWQLIKGKNYIEEVNDRKCFIYIIKKFTIIKICKTTARYIKYNEFDVDINANYYIGIL